MPCMRYDTVPQCRACGMIPCPNAVQYRACCVIPCTCCTIPRSRLLRLRCPPRTHLPSGPHTSTADSWKFTCSESFASASTSLPSGTFRLVRCMHALRPSVPCMHALRPSVPCMHALRPSVPCMHALRPSVPCMHALRPSVPCMHALRPSVPCMHALRP
eukprot:Polyplicarium_translucidae@DN1572_c0_g1_i2.p2